MENQVKTAVGKVVNLGEFLSDAMSAMSTSTSSEAQGAMTMANGAVNEEAERLREEYVQIVPHHAWEECMCARVCVNTYMGLIAYATTHLTRMSVGTMLAMYA